MAKVGPIDSQSARRNNYLDWLLAEQRQRTSNSAVEIDRNSALPPITFFTFTVSDVSPATILRLSSVTTKETTPAPISISSSVRARHNLSAHCRRSSGTGSCPRGRKGRGYWRQSERRKLRDGRQKTRLTALAIWTNWGSERKRLGIGL
jgi:hypothetical protein